MHEKLHLRNNERQISEVTIRDTCWNRHCVRVDLGLQDMESSIRGPWASSATTGVRVAIGKQEVTFDDFVMVVITIEKSVKDHLW